MPKQRMTGHVRRLIAGELRHRREGGDPVLFTEYSYKKLKEILHTNKGMPVLVSEGPKEKKDGTD